MDGLKFGIVIPCMRWPSGEGAPREALPLARPALGGSGARCRIRPRVLRLGERHRDIVPREARRVVPPDEVATDAQARSGAAR